MSNKCGCREQMLRRLADFFGAPNWGGDAVERDTDGVGDVLGITGEEVEVLCAAGLLRSTPSGNITAAELCCFLEEHGAWWVQVRLQKQVQELKESIERAAVRAAWNAESETAPDA